MNANVFQFQSGVMPVLTEAAAKAGIVAVDTSYRTVRWGLIEEWTVYAPCVGMAIVAGGKVDVRADAILCKRVDPEIAREAVACVGGVYKIPVLWRGLFVACLLNGRIVRIDAESA